LDAAPSVAAALIRLNGSWMKGLALLMRTQACTNMEWIKSPASHGFSGETLDFDTIDWCFAKMAAAGFVVLIAVVAWMWLG
jgi:hypothetical protein